MLKFRRDLSWIEIFIINSNRIINSSKTLKPNIGPPTNIRYSVGHFCQVLYIDRERGVPQFRSRPNIGPPTNIRYSVGNQVYIGRERGVHQFRRPPATHLFKTHLNILAFLYKIILLVLFHQPTIIQIICCGYVLSLA